MDSAVLIHRLHFAFTATFHYLFPQLTMGLAPLVVDRILDAAGETIIAWEHVYLISDTEHGLTAVAALPDNELAAWDARAAQG